MTIVSAAAAFAGQQLLQQEQYQQSDFTFTMRHEKLYW